MKTFIFSLPARLRSFNEKLDVKGALCGKSWEVFNDEGAKQLFIFNTDGTLLITLNGKVIKSSWQYIPANSSVLITTDDETTMFRPAFYDNMIFALQQDGVERYMFMIDEQQKSAFPEITLKALNEYFEEKERKAIEAKRDKALSIQRKQDEEDEKQIEILEKQKADERQELYHYLVENKEVIFQEYHEHMIKQLSIALLVLVISLVCIIFGLLYIHKGILPILSTVIGFGVFCIALICFSNIIEKPDYVMKRYEADTNTQIQYLDKDDINHICEDL